LLRCLHVEDGEEQHLTRNSNFNIEATPLVHVKIEIGEGQASESRLGLGLNARREYLIKNK
jgi:hypothetical protein